MSYIILVEKNKIDEITFQLNAFNIEVINKFPLIGLLIASSSLSKINIEEVKQNIKGIISIEENRKFYTKEFF